MRPSGAGTLTGAVAFPLAEQIEGDRAEALAARDRLELPRRCPSTEVATSVDAETWDALDTATQLAVAEPVLSALSAIYAKRAGSPTANPCAPSRLEAVRR